MIACYLHLPCTPASDRRTADWEPGSSCSCDPPDSRAAQCNTLGNNQRTGADGLWVDPVGVNSDLAASHPIAAKHFSRSLAPLTTALVLLPN